MGTLPPGFPAPPPRCTQRSPLCDSSRHQPGSQSHSISCLGQTDTTLTSMPVTVYPLGFLLGFFLPFPQGCLLSQTPEGGLRRAVYHLVTVGARTSLWGKTRGRKASPGGPWVQTRGDGRDNAKAVSRGPASVRLHLPNRASLDGWTGGEGAGSSK